MADENIISDGNVTFIGGQDASRDPDQVPPEAFFAGVNVTTKKGVLGPRDGFGSIDLVIPDGGITLPTKQVRSYRDIFSSGRFQALIPYIIGVENFIIVVVSGVMYLINESTFEVQILELPDNDTLNESSPRLNWSEAGNYYVIFDFPNFPVIIEGTTARRADPDKDEVPVSVLGAYNQNRLFIGNAGNDYTAGDPTGSLATPDAPITFFEVLEPSTGFTGQVFQLPTGKVSTQISAMGFLQMVDTSTGMGPLIIGTRDSVFSAQSQLPRTAWTSNQFASKIIANSGIAGPRAQVNVGSDLFFLSSDCQMRSLSMSRQEQLKWARVPMSREVENWLVSKPELSQYSALGYYNNRIYVTANPYRVEARDLAGNTITDYAFGGFVVLELENISSLGTENRPTWAGLWTGIRPMDMCNSGGRFFIMSKDPSFQNKLYEITPGVTYDMNRGIKRLIKSRVYTREYSFNNAYQDKEIQSLDIEPGDLRGDFKIDISFKPSHGEYFIPWKTFKHYVPYEICEMPDLEVNGLEPQQLGSINIGFDDTDACDPVLQKLYRWFRKIQLLLVIEGDSWSIKSFRAKAVIRPQTETAVICGPLPVVKLLQSCDENWNVEEFNTCQVKELRERR